MFLWCLCSTTVGLIFKSHDSEYLVFTHPTWCQANGFTDAPENQNEKPGWLAHLHLVQRGTVASVGPWFTPEFTCQLFGKS